MNLEVMVLKTMKNWSPHLIGFEFFSKQKKLDLDMKNHDSPHAKPPIEDSKIRA